jgi:hypothetical protein
MRTAIIAYVHVRAINVLSTSAATLQEFEIHNHISFQILILRVTRQKVMEAYAIAKFLIHTHIHIATERHSQFSFLSVFCDPQFSIEQCGCVTAVVWLSALLPTAILIRHLTTNV